MIVNCGFPPQSKKEEEGKTVQHPCSVAAVCALRRRVHQDQEEGHIHTQTPPKKASGPDQQRLWARYLDIQEGLLL